MQKSVQLLANYHVCCFERLLSRASQLVRLLARIDWFWQWQLPCFFARIVRSGLRCESLVQLERKCAVAQTAFYIDK